MIKIKFTPIPINIINYINLVISNIMVGYPKYLYFRLKWNKYTCNYTIVINNDIDMLVNDIIILTIFNNDNHNNNILRFPLCALSALGCRKRVVLNNNQELYKYISKYIHAYLSSC